MALKIGLARGGRKKRPFYRVVVQDKRAPRDGRFVERVGTYDPLRTEDKSTFQIERAQYWLSVGAQPTARVSKLLALHGISTGTSARVSDRPD